ncbi:retinoid-inducible serine carboxypeptidase-like [Drosophila guanche]|uniref:Blast:Retinoid-inducible serine carboxypeptidase n=1 Tax=Drosophila guanche TaxID=7266 RepID=A0A3B0K3D6_DROGU|nr:retinoid-inducible serine carboxypeptidase-like [Drosophila guanche]SPP82450.1 blast:Retinoid-inducible serine carboxypeptidase [Drosophila guanche]
MSRALSCIVVLFAHLVWISHGRRGYGPGEQDWGHIEVRPGGYMFYWLFYTTGGNIPNYADRPLIIWLQGGPGSASTSYGNFGELGPIDMDSQMRHSTWVKDFNVLFIDQPLGTGFSYLDNHTKCSENNRELGKDLVSFMNGFYSRHRVFQKVPLHIFGQSYGAKVASEFALQLQNETTSKLISVNLVSPWISPLLSVMSWGRILLTIGAIDDQLYSDIHEASLEVGHLMKRNLWSDATNQMFTVQRLIAAQGIDLYNFMEPTENTELRENQLMNGPVRVALNLSESLQFESFSNVVFESLSSDFMKAALTTVEQLLEGTSLKVNIISGQLDLICSTLSTVHWIKRLKWSGRGAYSSAPREAIIVRDKIEGFQKTGGTLTMFWVKNAGHSVPVGNARAMSEILKTLRAIK